MVNECDIDELLSRWKQAKDEITDLEKKCNRYKKAVEKIMESNGTNVLKSKTLTVTKNMTEREILSKNDVPKDVWKYARKIMYPVFRFRNNQQQKKT
jgi:hypothetical protein